MTIRFKRISAIIIILLLICCGISYSHHNSNQTKLHKVKDVNMQLTRKIAYKRKHAHRPVLTKKVPSAYKKLMMDGKSVANAQNTIIKQTNGGRKKGTPSTTAYRSAESTLSNLIYLKTSNWNIKEAWSPFTNDKVRIMPGEANSDGHYDCSFVVYEPRSGRIDGIYEAQYDASERRFSDISDYGERQQKMSAKASHKLHLNLIKHNHKHPIKRHVKGGPVPHVK